MEERNISGEFPSMSPNTSSWSMNNTTVKESDYCTIISSYLDILLFIIAILGLAGNATVLWLLGFCMQRNAFTVYVLNLAGADFLYLCFQTVYSLKNIFRQFHSIYFNIPIFFLDALIFAYLVGLCMISAISVERCLSVLWPIWYHCQRPRHLSSLMCALLWALSLMLSLLFGDGCGLFDRSRRAFSCGSYSFIIIPYVIVLPVALCICSLILFVRIFCGSKRIPVTRLYVTIAFTTLVFILFGLPFSICLFLLLWNVGWRGVVPCIALDVTAFLSCVNSCANPIIYFLVGSIRHHRFQKRTLKILLQRAMQDTPEEEDGERSSSGNRREQSHLATE